MSIPYLVQFQNDSPNSGSFCLIQSFAKTNESSFLVAWITRKCHPGTTITYRWKPDWNMVWCQTEILSPTAEFSALQVVEADPDNPEKNHITLTRQDGAYRFVPDERQASTGTFCITADCSIPNHQVSIGIGMAGFPSILIQAGPNRSYSLDSHIDYWACFGDYEQGQILDPNILKQAFRLDFPVNVNALSLTLNEANQWSCAIMKPLSSSGQEYSS